MEGKQAKAPPWHCPCGFAEPPLSPGGGWMLMTESSRAPQGAVVWAGLFFAVINNPNGGFLHWKDKCSLFREQVM